MIRAKNWNAIDNFAEPVNEQIMDINYVLANCSDEEEIFPLTISEIAEEQLKDKSLQQQKVLTLTNIELKLEETLIKNTYVLCKEGKLVIPKTLQHKAVA